MGKGYEKECQQEDKTTRKERGEKEMNEIGWLVAAYIIGVLYILSPWIAVTYLSHYDDKSKKNEKK